jgi:hypothetical protein
MSAVIQIRPLLRPVYDNRSINSFTAWFETNKRALIAWWWDCHLALLRAGEVLGTPAEHVDFIHFCETQWDHERAQVGGLL